MLAADFEVRRRRFSVALRLRLEPGERLALLGPSGAGKTTSLEALAGLVRLSRGEITLEGRVLSSAAGGRRDVPAGQRRVGLLRQNPGLFPHLTVLQNIAYATGADPRAARAAGERLGIGGLLSVRPRGLSGGEAQRVALARTLQTRVALLCLDEPFSSLDAALAQELLELVRSELASSGTAAVLVTHKLEEAQSFADRIAVMHRGRVLQVAEPSDLVLHPQSAAVASLVGYRGWLRRGGQLMAIHPDRAFLATQAADTLEATVTAVRPAGARMDIVLSVDDGWRGSLHLAADRAPETRERVFVRVPAAPVFSGPEADLE